MRIACISFSNAGEKIATRIRDNFSYVVDCFNKDNYRKNFSRIFGEYQGIVFISSTGIAVRICAPYLKNKISDPAIVVIDDTGKYAISLVSGHLGGANDLTQELANFLKCQPIITTASDNRGIEAVDLFAKKYDLFIEDLNAAKTVTAMMVDGKRIGFYSLLNEKIHYPNLVKSHPEGCIFVDVAERIECSVPACILRPKILFIGIGCRKGKAGYEILDAIEQVFQQNNLSLKSVKAIATIELKKNEPGIHEASHALRCDMRIFSDKQIAEVQDQFEPSAFVEETTGVKSVSEPCAYLAGGELIIPKKTFDGITIAVSQSK